MDQDKPESVHRKASREWNTSGLDCLLAKKMTSMNIVHLFELGVQYEAGLYMTARRGGFTGHSLESMLTRARTLPLIRALLSDPFERF